MLREKAQKWLIFLSTVPDITCKLLATGNGKGGG
jgi:hypothetical protein